jgi:hypothetical protein
MNRGKTLIAVTMGAVYASSGCGTSWEGADVDIAAAAAAARLHAAYNCRSTVRTRLEQPPFDLSISLRWQAAARPL